MSIFSRNVVAVRVVGNLSEKLTALVGRQGAWEIYYLQQYLRGLVRGSMRSKNVLFYLFGGLLLLGA